MRHNQNGRRFRGRSNNGSGGQSGGGQGGGGHTTHHQASGGNNAQGGNNSFRRVNRGTQTFDSNGPEVRIRGNAYQINEKYVTLAKDAASAGDRILSESYLQHAEHYQRMINEIAEEMGRHQQQFPQQEFSQQDGAPVTGEEEPQTDMVVTTVAQPGAEQPSDQGLDDISFLRNPVRSSSAPVQQQEIVAEGEPATEDKKPRHSRQRQTEQV